MEPPTNALLTVVLFRGLFVMCTIEVVNDEHATVEGLPSTERGKSAHNLNSYHCFRWPITVIKCLFVSCWALYAALYVHSLM